MPDLMFLNGRDGAAVFAGVAFFVTHGGGGLKKPSSLMWVGHSSPFAGAVPSGGRRLLRAGHLEISSGAFARCHPRAAVCNLARPTAVILILGMSAPDRHGTAVATRECMKPWPLLLLVPAFIATSCEKTKLYPAKASAFRSPNPANITGEDDETPQASDHPGGSTSPGVTQGAPATTGTEPPATPQPVEPGEVPAGGQAAGSSGGGSSSVPPSGGQGLPRQAPPK
jgi:hypothetical protein